MRLLKSLESDNLEFVDQVQEDKVSYAILSHRWGNAEDEVNYQDVMSGTGKDKKGYRKVLSCMRQACKDGYPYFWVDTCCINKESSAELSEAINSMYRWYKNSRVCYAYLEDVHRPESNVAGRHVWESEWFERGWTLQELIAPSEVWFFNKSWDPTGSKKSLAVKISHTTRIDIHVLNGGSIHRLSVAQRMSWAAKRETTRPEDRAYCLLGIFDINMPLLYGEGDRAFRRLQEEIIRKDDDHSIFAWQMSSDSNVSGLLAPSPENFQKCSSATSRISPQGRKAFKMTNRGLSISFEMTPFGANTYLAFLDSEGRRANKMVRLGVFLRRLGEDDQFARVNLRLAKRERRHVTIKNGLFFGDCRIYQECHEENAPRPMRIQRVFVRSNVELVLHSKSLKHQNYGLLIPDFLKQDCAVFGFTETYSTDRILRLSAPWSMLVFKVKLETTFNSAAIGFDFDLNPICFLVEAGKSINIEHWCTGFPSWEEYSFSPIERGRAYRQSSHNGIWYLKGSRHYGLDVTLLKVLNGVGPNITFHRVARDDNSSSDNLWALEIDVPDMETPGTGSVHHQAAPKTAFRT